MSTKNSVGGSQNDTRERKLSLTRTVNHENGFQLFGFYCYWCSYYVVCSVSWVPVLHFVRFVESIFSYCCRIYPIRDGKRSYKRHTNWMNRVKKVVGISQNFHMTVGITLWVVRAFYGFILFWFDLVWDLNAPVCIPWKWNVIIDCRNLHSKCHYQKIICTIVAFIHFFFCKKRAFYSLNNGYNSDEKSLSQNITNWVLLAFLLCHAWRYVSYYISVLLESLTFHSLNQHKNPNQHSFTFPPRLVTSHNHKWMATRALDTQLLADWWPSL